MLSEWCIYIAGLLHVAAFGWVKKYKKCTKNNIAYSVRTYSQGHSQLRF